MYFLKKDTVTGLKGVPGVHPCRPNFLWDFGESLVIPPPIMWNPGSATCRYKVTLHL